VVRNVPERPTRLSEGGFPVKTEVAQQVVVERTKRLALVVKQHRCADAAKKAFPRGGGAVKCEAVHV
jgi:hypothetical protein